jgi:hypothetical protein
MEHGVLSYGDFNKIFWLIASAHIFWDNMVLMGALVLSTHFAALRLLA